MGRGQSIPLPVHCQSLALMTETAQQVHDSVGLSDHVAGIGNMRSHQACATVFIATLAACEVVLHVVLLVFGMGDRTVTVHVVAGKWMLEAGAAVESTSGGGEEGDFDGLGDFGFHDGG